MPRQTTARFSIQVDPRRDLIRITMGGLFSLKDVEAFVDARQKAHAQLLCGPNEHLTLNDLRDMKIQLQEVVTAFKAVLAAPEYRSRKLAFVTNATLTRNQLLRAIDSRQAQCFEDVESAEAWLFGEGDRVSR